MKNQLLVTFENNQFVLTELKQIVSTAVLIETLDTTELSNIIQTAGYKNAKFSEDAKGEFRKIEREIKAANKLKNDVKRQEREAKKAERIKLKESKIAERMAKLQAQLEKLKTN
jgi:Zn-dependent M32 family carboxypeptidase